MAANPLILFETEGTYPYSGGGVSTWSHILCSELEEEVDFILLPLTGLPFVESRYPLSSNIKSIIHIPLWGSAEPVHDFDKQTPFSEHILRKFQTDQSAIRNLFLPMFRDFIHRLFDPFSSPKEFGELIYGFWKYYQAFDYKETLSSPLVWTEFKKQLKSRYNAGNKLKRQEEPSVKDATFGMRWIYHFMMPLAVPLPQVSATHATLAGFPAIASIAAKFEYGTPMVLTDHGVYIRERLVNVSQSEMSYFSKKMLIDLATFITRTAYHYADIIAPVTSVHAKWESDFEAGEDRIQPIYNGVDPDKFHPRSKPEHTKGIPTVVAAAQVFPLKDIETMIRSCDHARREIPDIQYILYGSLDVDKTYTQKCMQLVEQLGLEDHFVFGGFNDSPNLLFNEGDISILSSISEGFPYTVIESMSCGRPVVATDVGGVSEAIGDTGVICKPRDAKALAEGVIKLLTNDKLRRKLGRKARARILENYTITESVANYHEIYKQLHNQENEPAAHAIELDSVITMIQDLERYGREI
ncbi:GT4 family glycosyltransferase PelF [Fodinibius sediminis]|uniref:Glycosyltransferase involved in cell wall bisynthesis n=1 Tax=Fodinibius sediminis TaxID=1214077 RepID=A0A521CQS5_9BACT|nr:GT4 family glycosyltransferase PelF [Fodinibius sediminis]SMO61783.1 Glycosyltransferase involved in cell wall bisynthesis [Fodinibius sediminis]